MPAVGFILSQPPHGDASGREGLDAILATSAYSEDLALYFVGDGVYQLVREQAADAILGRNYLPTFGMLELYDIDQVYLCQQSLEERGLSPEDLALDAVLLSPAQLAGQFSQCRQLLKF